MNAASSATPVRRGASLPAMDFAPAALGSWLLFDVDGQVCAVDSRELRQIALPTALVALPGCAWPAWPGVFAWHQRALSVLDCGAAMGQRPSLGRGSSRVLVVEDEASLFALLVDQVRELHQESPQRLIGVQAGLPAPWNAVRALLPLAPHSGAEAAAVLHVPTLFRGSLDGIAPPSPVHTPSTELRS